MRARALRRPSREDLRRLAQFGFWFFLIKGLLWLTLPLALAWWMNSDAF